MNNLANSVSFPQSFMQNLLGELHDVQGLEVVSWWPLAIGWWVVIGVFLVAIIGGSYYWLRRVKYRKSGEYFLSLELAEVVTVNELSEVIKKIIVLKFGRENCASLTDNKLLNWLEKNDTQGFLWREKGVLLLDKNLYGGSCKIEKKNEREAEDKNRYKNDFKQLKAAIGKWL